MSSAWWMRGERTRVRAAGDRLQDRSFELDEAALLEHRADRAQDRGAREHRSSGRLVGDQVEVPAALLQIRVLQPVPLLGKGPERLREHRPALGEQAELAAPRRAHRALHADDVAEVQLAQQRERVRRRAGRGRTPPGARRRGRGSSRTPACPDRASARHGRRGRRAPPSWRRAPDRRAPRGGRRSTPAGRRRGPTGGSARTRDRSPGARATLAGPRGPRPPCPSSPRPRPGLLGAPGLLGLLSHRPAPGSVRGPAGGPRA